jgi:DNA-directed RNA polymerase specialized sigma24 family protein
MTEPMAQPKTEGELKDAIDALLRSIRHERDRWDEGLATLRSWLEGPLRHATLELLAAAARRERLEFQWKLEELVEAYAPPPPPKPAAPPAPAAAPEFPAKAKDEAWPSEPKEPEFPAKAKDEAWPTKADEPAPAAAGAIRPEDLALIAEDPRGFALAEHRPTGDWYLITGQDPRSGQLQMRKLSVDEKRALQAQLGVL